MLAAPRVSVVTPFYNAAEYLPQCIESVLSQTHGDFEYLLVNNKSTDGSRDIAARYAEKDARLRLIDNDEFVGQVENYNAALARIAVESKYVKIVQADDALFPDCLRLMVEVVERAPRIGLMGSFYLKGSTPAGAGIPFGQWCTPGIEVCRRMLLDKIFPIGSPSAVLYRADIVRTRQPFYRLGRYHEDTEAAYEILLENDFGFVHQICSFLRTDNISIMSAARRFNPGPLDYLINIELFGPRVLSKGELEELRSREWRSYFNFLASSLLRRREKAFWDYHRRGLATIGRKLGRGELAAAVLRVIARLGMNPLSSTQRALEALSAGRWREP